MFLLGVNQLAWKEEAVDQEVEDTSPTHMSSV